MDNNYVIENRLKTLKGAYDRLESFIDNLGEALPKTVTDAIKDCVLGDEELKELMNGLEKRRTPRIMILGRTGIGKSSLINALCEGYVAEVNDYRSCTSGVNRHFCKDDDGRVLMEVLDSRGFSENKALKDSSAEEDLLKNIIEFFPDAILFVLGCDRRDDSISADLDFLKKARKVYKETFYQDVPIIAVINRADTVAPKTELHPDNYSERKIVGINKIMSEYRTAFKNKKVKFNDVIAVSSLIEWKLDDGSEYGRPVIAEEIENLTDEEKRHITIDFDGRYQIERLRDAIANSIESPEARMGFTMALKLDALVLKLAKRITSIFSTISGTVALTPIMLSDIYVLVPLQAALVSLIAILAGREADIKSAKEFVVSLGGVTAFGYACRILAQQAAKAVNAILPTGGSFLSSGIASTATNAIGKAAIDYYLLDKDFELLKAEAKEKIKMAA